MQNNDAFTKQTPDFKINFTPKKKNQKTKHDNKIKNTGIVPNKTKTFRQQHNQFKKRHILSHANTGGRQRRREPLQSADFGFASDEQEVECRAVDEMLQEFGPFVFGPVLFLAAAARMEGELV